MTLNTVAWRDARHATAGYAGDDNPVTLCGVRVYGGDLNRKLPIGWWDGIESETLPDGSRRTAAFITCRRCGPILARRPTQ